MQLDPTINNDLHIYIWDKLLKKYEMQTIQWVIQMDSGIADDNLSQGMKPTTKSTGAYLNHCHRPRE